MSKKKNSLHNVQYVYYIKLVCQKQKINFFVRPPFSFKKYFPVIRTIVRRCENWSSINTCFRMDTGDLLFYTRSNSI